MVCNAGATVTADAARTENTTEGLVVFTRRHVYYSLTGEFRVTCPFCHWSADDDWGWPAFTPPFLSAVGALLGNRTVHPYGKL